MTGLMKTKIGGGNNNWAVKKKLLLSLSIIGRYSILYVDWTKK